MAAVADPPILDPDLIAEVRKRVVECNQAMANYDTFESCGVDCTEYRRFTQELCSTLQTVLDSFDAKGRIKRKG